MDPDFAEAFSTEYPEAYGRAVRSQRTEGARSKSDAAITVHVPVIPPFLSRFTAGVAVMLVLIGGFFAISQATGNESLSIPSGQLMSKPVASGTGTAASSIDSIFKIPKGISTLSSSSTDLNQKLVTIDEMSKKMLKEWLP